MQIVIIVVDTVISIHALLAESDDAINGCNSDIEGFLSTLSLRRATTFGPTRMASGAYFYPRSPCGERLQSTNLLSLSFDFYPRSPCGERRFSSCRPGEPSGISIHALLAESDAFSMYGALPAKIFLSTLSLRRATLQIHGKAPFNNFYPRSPCGERQVGQKRLRQKLAISIHALLAESDRELV